MAYTPEQFAVLRKYRLIKEDGTPVITKIFTKDENNQPMGAGPKLAPDVVDKFLRTTNDPAWLDWLFHQAAGGKPALDEMPRFTEQLKRKYSERLTQMQQEKGVPIATIRQNMEDSWAKYIQSNADFFAVGDEEVAKKGAYGFFRHWPGPKGTGSSEGLYARLVRVLPEYLKTLPYIERYNKRAEDHVLGSTPGQVKDVGDMEEITKKVQRHFAVQKAAKDVRIGGSKPVYDDDYLTIIVPLSYAASVKYGYHGWAWANPQAFQSFLANPSPDKWNEATQNQVFAYVRFHVPVPSTLVKEPGAEGLHMSRRFLTNLALGLPKAAGSISERDIVVYSEEGGIKTSVDNIRRSMRAEAERKDTPDSPENPIQQGPRVYKTKDEFIDAYLAKLGDSSDENMDRAEQAWERYYNEQEPDPQDKPYLSSQKHTIYVEKVIKHFDTAIDTLLKWANKFDWSQVKSNTLSLD